VKVAVFGSRQGYDLDRVARWVVKLWEKQGKDTILVSGGAEGVDRMAEQTWLALGGQVKSFRPVKTGGDLTSEDEYGIEVWELGGEHPTVSRPGNEPRFADYTSAATYRDMLIAEEADRGMAFWANKSRGTAGTITFFEVQGKPIYVAEEARDGAVA
jgi:hypothetical protein